MVLNLVVLYGCNQVFRPGTHMKNLIIFNNIINKGHIWWILWLID